MAKSPRSIYEVMNRASEQHDLDARQRKALYEWLESHDVLEKSKDPFKDATKFAKELKKQAEQLKKNSKAAAMRDKSSVRGGRKKSSDDVEEAEDDFVFESFDGDGGTWIEEDVDREECPDYYDEE